MAVDRPNISDEARRAFLAGVRDFLETDGPEAEKISDGSVPIEAVDVFTLTLRDVLQGEGIRAASPAGIQIVTTRAEQVIAGDVVQAPGETGLRMTSLSQDPRLARMIEFMHTIDDLPEIKDRGSYELKLLRIPAILVDAFWVKSEQGKGDLIIPVLSASRELITERVYEADEFLKVVRRLAERFRKFDEIAGDRWPGEDRDQ